MLHAGHQDAIELVEAVKDDAGPRAILEALSLLSPLSTRGEGAKDTHLNIIRDLEHEETISMSPTSAVANLSSHVNLVNLLDKTTSNLCGRRLVEFLGFFSKVLPVAVVDHDRKAKKGRRGLGERAGRMKP